MTSQIHLEKFKKNWRGQILPLSLLFQRGPITIGDTIDTAITMKTAT